MSGAKRNTIIRKSLLIFSTIFIAGNLTVYLLLDKTSILTFFSILLAGSGGLWLASKQIFKRNPLTVETRQNLLLLIISFSIGCTASELIVRYGWGKYASYLEKNGAFFTDASRRNPLHNYLSSLSAGKDRVFYQLRAPNKQISPGNKEFSYPIKTNSIGIRDEEPPGPKSSEEYRLIGLGDSFTEGIGAPIDSTWLNQLGKLLRQTTPKEQIRLISGGVSGSDPFFNYRFLKDRLLHYKPDLVILTVNTSDIHDVYIRGGMERFGENDQLQSGFGPIWWESLYLSSHMVRLIVHDVLGYDRWLIKTVNRTAVVAQMLEKLAECIEAFGALAKEHNFEMLVVFHPFLSELEEQNFPLQTLVDRFEEKDMFHVLNLYDYFSEIASRDGHEFKEYYWPTDQHHRPFGYLEFAKGIYLKIREIQNENTIENAIN